MSTVLPSSKNINLEINSRFPETTHVSLHRKKILLIIYLILYFHNMLLILAINVHFSRTLIYFLNKISYNLTFIPAQISSQFEPEFYPSHSPIQMPLLSLFFPSEMSFPTIFIKKLPFSVWLDKNVS